MTGIKLEWLMGIRSSGWKMGETVGSLGQNRSYWAHLSRLDGSEGRRGKAFQAGGPAKALKQELSWYIMATHSSMLAWKIPWTEEPDRLQSVGSQRIRHDWATSLSLSLYEQFFIYSICLVFSFHSPPFTLSAFDLFAFSESDIFFPSWEYPSTC